MHSGLLIIGLTYSSFRRRAPLLRPCLTALPSPAGHLIDPAGPHSVAALVGPLLRLRRHPVVQLGLAPPPRPPALQHREETGPMVVNPYHDNLRKVAVSMGTICMKLNNNIFRRLNRKSRMTLYMLRSFLKAKQNDFFKGKQLMKAYLSLVYQICCLSFKYLSNDSNGENHHSLRSYILCTKNEKAQSSIRFTCHYLVLADVIAGRTNEPNPFYMLQ